MAAIAPAGRRRPTESLVVDHRDLRAVKGDRDGPGSPRLADGGASTSQRNPDHDALAVRPCGSRRSGRVQEKEGNRAGRWKMEDGRSEEGTQGVLATRNPKTLA